MGIFGSRSRVVPAAGPGAGGGVSDSVIEAVPPRFAAVAEAIASGPHSAEPLLVAGRELARDGVALDATLEALHIVSHRLTGREPAFDDVRALCLGWSEAMLGYFHQLSCEDSMTGLSSLAHLRTRLAEHYRGRTPVRDAHALVVIDVVSPASGAPGAVLALALHLAAVGDMARTVFSGTETIARASSHRLIVLAHRDDRLGQRVALLRRLLGDLEGDTTPRLWIEGLPASDSSCAGLLDELARG